MASNIVEFLSSFFFFSRTRYSSIDILQLKFIGILDIYICSAANKFVEQHSESLMEGVIEDNFIL